jgi:ketosteroid isomerase-like protein
MVLMAMPLLAACRSSGHVNGGAPFAGAALLAPLSEAEEAHDALLRADLGRADSVTQAGYSRGLASAFASDVVYLRGGIPMVKGRAAALAILAAESVPTTTAVRWQPVRAEASRDGRSGYSYGYTIYSTPQPAGAPSVRIDRYIAYWRRQPEGWRVAAYAETYGAPPPALSLPPAVTSAVIPDVPMRRTRGPLDEIRAVDSDFSAEAERNGTGRAFGRYAADDAQIFSAPGEFITGPRAITQSFGPANEKSRLVWHPVHGEVSLAGDMGFTVGNAVLTGEREDGAPLLSASKYLTVWRRQADGGWRYVVDGGSARPFQ